MVPAAPADDIAIIAARLPAVPERLSETWPADKDVLADVRMLLRRWLRAQGAADDEAYDIVVATQEACANAVEHAYGPEVRPFELDAVCEDGRITVTVRDHGNWRPPRGTNRGRGLPHDAGAHGARRRRPHRRGDHRGARAHARQEGGMTSWIARVYEERHGEVAVAAVEGEIDSSNVGEIGDRVRAMLTNRSEALVIDLEQTHYIDSAGINLLFTLGTELDERQQRLLLVVAPSPGSRGCSRSPAWTWRSRRTRRARTHWPPRRRDERQPRLGREAGIPAALAVPGRGCVHLLSLCATN